MRSVLPRSERVPQHSGQYGSDLERLKAEYEARELRLAGSDIYSPFNLSYLFAVQQRQRAMLDLMRREGFSSLHGKRVLDLGCGRGRMLVEFLGYNASVDCLHGTDLILNRVQDAHKLLPHLPVTCADAQQLPYEANSFDVVFQFTVFSSVLDWPVKKKMAREMLRVVRPGGMILWYDFWFNPTNRETAGIRLAELRALFPNCRYTFKRITLAPPITRRLASRSWLLCMLLEKLRLFNTHYLVAIRPQERTSWLVRH